VGVATDVIIPGESDGLSLYRPLSPGSDTLLVRFTGEVGPARAAVRAAIARADPRLKPHLRTLQERFDQQAAELKPAAGLTLGLGLVALILALVGVHGVVAFSARRQLKEIGVRMALGAQRRDVIKALALPAVRCVALGLGSGLLITLLSAPILARAVQEMNVWDPLPYAGSALLLAITALAAMVGPARWALAVDPAVVLRED
jgi:ABC-type antimicrobial peptide transport system permease subunit